MFYYVITIFISAQCMSVFSMSLFLFFNSLAHVPTFFQELLGKKPWIP